MVTLANNKVCIHYPNDIGDGLFVDVYHAIDPSTVCQYTGVKDSKGQEIWVGDLIQNEHTKNIYEIIWSKRRACYEAINPENRDALPLPLGWFVNYHNTIVLRSKFDKEGGV